MTRSPRGVWAGEDPQEKLPAPNADELDGSQGLSEDLRLRASQIRLQSTMMSASARALINREKGRRAKVTIVASFRALEVRGAADHLEREGIRLEVPLKQRRCP